MWASHSLDISEEKSSAGVSDGGSFLYVARKATLHAPYADVQSFWLGKDYTFRHLNFNMCATKFQDSLQVIFNISSENSPASAGGGMNRLD